MIDTISRAALETLIQSRAPLALLEALPEKYYRHGHLPGARLFPHERAAELANELLLDKSAAIVVYCASETCSSSHQAAESLTGMGYSNVRVYVEGKAGWQAAGLALER